MTTSLCRAVYGIALFAASHLFAATYFVDASRPDDNGAGTSWASAKKTIQAAVNQTVDGDTVIVTNGVYNVGATPTPGYAVSNRVAISRPITVRSLNGATATVIEGSGVGTYGTARATRCVLMSNGVLDGFTLRGGVTHPHTSYENNYDKSGGGVCMFDCVAGTQVRNCIIRDCKAYDGGGAHSGTLINCLLFGNSAQYGGGAYRVSLPASQ